MGLSEGEIRYSMTDDRWPMTDDKKIIAGENANSKDESANDQRPTTNEIQPTIESIFRSLALAAPYLELIEEMTLSEFLEFHENSNPFIHRWNTFSQIMEACGSG